MFEFGTSRIHSAVLQGRIERKTTIPRPRMAAPVAQLAEAMFSKPIQCEFESHLGPHKKHPFAQKIPSP